MLYRASEQRQAGHRGAWTHAASHSERHHPIAHLCGSPLAGDAPGSDATSKRKASPASGLLHKGGCIVGRYPDGLDPGCREAVATTPLISCRSPLAGDAPSSDATSRRKASPASGLLHKGGCIVGRYPDGLDPGCRAAVATTPLISCRSPLAGDAPSSDATSRRKASPASGLLHKDGAHRWPVSGRSKSGVPYGSRHHTAHLL